MQGKTLPAFTENSCPLSACTASWTALRTASACVRTSDALWPWSYRVLQIHTRVLQGLASLRLPPEPSMVGTAYNSVQHARDSPTPALTPAASQAPCTWAPQDPHTRAQGTSQNVKRQTGPSQGCWLGKTRQGAGWRQRNSVRQPHGSVCQPHGSALQRTSRTLPRQRGAHSWAAAGALSRG